MAMKLSNQEKKELDKFIKFLALKSIQVIVQSRLGEKVSTACKPHTTGTDWFNLNISDLPDVLAEAKRVLNGEVLSSCLPLCVEISLRTSEGDHMVLESWCLGMLPEQCDSTPRIIHTIYNRMGILLKSLVSVTRVLPAYKLSRKQGEDTFVICYRVYMDEPQLHCLGEGYKYVRVGQICTPVGTLVLSVSYRVKMTISPTHTGRDSIMLKSDHFNTNLSPKNRRYNDTEEKITSLSDTMKKIGAFADFKKKDFEPELIIPNAPFSRLFSVSKASPKSSEENDLLENVINDSRTAVDSQEGKKNAFRFGIPMIWREQKNHTTDCYFCSVDVKGFNSKNKRNISYPNLDSAIRPVPHSSEISIPQPPSSLDEYPNELEDEATLSPPDESSSDLSFDEDGRPQLFSQGELNDLEAGESERLTAGTESEAKTESNGNGRHEKDKLGALTMVSTNDDFIMVDLRTPFASVNENSELGRFYREWQTAPPLQAFIDLPPLEEIDVTKQLETFESEVNEYNTIVQSLCQSPNNN
nr:unnamed protein product [Callosobruchus chinensis]